MKYHGYTWEILSIKAPVIELVDQKLQRVADEGYTHLLLDSNKMLRKLGEWVQAWFCERDWKDATQLTMILDERQHQIRLYWIHTATPLLIIYYEKDPKTPQGAPAHP